ncbi:threonine/serine exporter family protein [Bacillus tuaregi]|uniref:threonine/serine exporter family protein n=1 Tax=Bacillus tuaregi TaxID=1816695 RepID=UPI0008F9322D|nr:threonine/serine exporter family protein [Bacillus tuaregi]
MTVIIQQLVTSYIASAAFGLLFNVPQKQLLQGGLSGMIGWIFYFLLVQNGIDSILASIFASILIGGIGQTFAKVYKQPVIVFNVSGIIPLVPGGLAYDAMRHFVSNDYDIAIQLAAKALLISGGIAAGLVVSEVFTRLIVQNRLKQKSALRGKVKARS